MAQKGEKITETLAYGNDTYLRVLNESYPKNINITGFIWFSKIFESSLSIGRVKFTFEHKSCFTCLYLSYLCHLFAKTYGIGCLND